MAIPKFLKGSVLVFDTETADLGDHIIEIGFSLFQDGKMVKEWGTLVKPLILINPEASAVHKIYDKDVEDQPTFAEVAWWIKNQLSIYDIHCAYNYDYDRDVLEKEFARVNMKFPLKPMVDPFILFKKWHKYNRGKRLGNAAQVYGISLVGAHRAMNDATATGSILFKMAAVKTTFPNSIKKYISTQRKWIEEQHLDFYSYRKKMGQELPTPPNFSYYEVEV
ncbi:MAG: 3'-5' exonuclease [Deltaproteobacteria bacterium]|nr:3'-5' exonuclease [Deltaproteobacteria bacterium]